MSTSPPCVQCGELERERDDARREAETLHRAWLRELGGRLIPKTHRIDALVLTTRMLTGRGLRSDIRAMMARREWSLHWIHRSAYLHLEAAELAEAVRGKRGDTLDESADVLITLLALSPHELPEIAEAAAAKIRRLERAPQYEGEERAT